ncbi:hypothetical protein [Paenibacillus sp. OAS669]|uniref:hypothetical protein n=1 Tax=Paenibacillus sp. OAS669 TaxID=2663821 RepID=UPI001789AC23|nr:hypothetical protein [Paenibacillus sp. OAS669]MBE1443600.1 hypothetical protein [Paenibacillus sp. OAS669]
MSAAECGAFFFSNGAMLSLIQAANVPARIPVGKLGIITTNHHGHAGESTGLCRGA